MTQTELLDQLDADLRDLLETIRTQMVHLDEKLLTKRPDDPKRWNIVECFDHLNRLYQDYLDPIELAIHRSKARKISPDTHEIQYNFLGRQMLRISDGARVKRHKTPKRYNPIHENVKVTAIKSFIINTERLLRIIQDARSVSLNRTKIKFVALPLLKYRLGNLLEILSVHGRRHTFQALRLIEEFK
jgi:DinB superfamily